MPQPICYDWKNEYTHRIHWQCAEKHVHSFWEFVLLTKGTAHHHCNEIVKDLTAGQLAFVRPTDFHYYILDGVLPNSLFPEGSGIPYEHRDLYIKIDVLDQAAEYIGGKEAIEYLLKPNYPVVINLTTAQRTNLESKLNLLEMYNEERKPYFEMLHRSLVCEILGLVIEKMYFDQSQYPVWLNELIQKMHSIDLIGGSLDDVVKASNFSHGHLCRLFKKYTGERIIDAFSRIKMQHACRLLTNPDLTVLQISSLVGYDSQSNFINQFKKYTGITPSAYRKNMTPGF